MQQCVSISSTRSGVMNPLPQEKGGRCLHREGGNPAPLVEKHFQERAAEPQVPPLRCAPVGMTRGGGGASRKQKPFFIALGGPKGP